MKKAFVRTEIIKYLNKLEKDTGKSLTVEDVFNCLPKLYDELKNNPENELEQLSFQEFRQLAELGYMIGQQKQQFGF